MKEGRKEEASRLVGRQERAACAVGHELLIAGKGAGVELWMGVGGQAGEVEREGVEGKIISEVTGWWCRQANRHMRGDHVLGHVVLEFSLG